MQQSTSPNGLHVAVIMDGNGRWAAARGLPRLAGHRAGSEAVRRTVEAAPRCGISTLTLYAFSADNWKRPREEVAELFRVLEEHLRTHAAECAARGVRIHVIGRRDRLPVRLVAAIDDAEEATAHGRTLDLRIAVDYSARDAILCAAQRLRLAPAPTRECFARLLADASHAPAPSPDVDLLIRTGGEQRLSDFLLWECAYAELLFLPKMWPDFAPADLEAAVAEFHRRDRRFGALPVAV
ncbi:MAG: di-trans,poly-cis-decaprenylcistransferase [Bryobacteraceae bacterium]|nr:di-trans,poly-cis-decaprenylcistransferase [Bryobacteraceae bacterium]